MLLLLSCCVSGCVDDVDDVGGGKDCGGTVNMVNRVWDLLRVIKWSLCGHFVGFCFVKILVMVMMKIIIIITRIKMRMMKKKVRKVNNEWSPLVKFVGQVIGQIEERLLIIIIKVINNISGKWMMARGGTSSSRQGTD